MNERKPTWSCPVCDKKIPFQTLVVDGLFTEILDSNRSERFTEVAFLEKSGASQGFTTIEWEPIIKEEKTVKQEPKTECGGKRHATAPIDLSPKSTSAQAKKSKKDEPEVIDLLSSDEEDGKTEGAMDLRHNSPDESDDTIVDGTSDDDTDDDDEYFADVYRRSKKGGGRNEAIDRQLRSGESRAMSTATSSNTAGRQMPLQLPPMHEDSGIEIEPSPLSVPNLFLPFPRFPRSNILPLSSHQTTPTSSVWIENFWCVKFRAGINV